MRIFSWILLSLCLSLGTFQLKAADMKLGIVDFQQALNSVEEGKTAKDKLKKEFEGKQKEIEKQKAELEKLQIDIEGMQKKAASGLLKPEAMEGLGTKEKEFRGKYENYLTLVQNHQKDISQKEMEATRGILTRLRDIVVELGRQDGYSMVLEKNESGLLYASNYTDLTEKLIQEYNKKYKAKKK